MESQMNKVCGIDVHVHKRFLIAIKIAIILSRDGTKEIQRFSATLENLLTFRDRLNEIDVNKQPLTQQRRWPSHSPRSWRFSPFPRLRFKLDFSHKLHHLSAIICVSVCSSVNANLDMS